MARSVTSLENRLGHGDEIHLPMSYCNLTASVRVAENGRCHPG
jgi:hypothetical protein